MQNFVFFSRNVNGVKQGTLTAITTPPAATSSPGLVPLAVWQEAPPEPDLRGEDPGQSGDTDS